MAFRPEISQSWEIPLDLPPLVVDIGRHAHGFVPKDSYCLPDLWSLHLFGYEAVLTQGSLEHRIKPGFIGVTPPGVPMTTRYFGISVHIYVHFRVQEGRIQKIPSLCDAGESYEVLNSDLYDAVLRFPQESACAQAALWSTLWKAVRLGGSGSIEDEPSHKKVRLAAEMIEHNLSRRLLPSELAEEIGISLTSLTRLFQKVYGESTAAYIRRRRMERAADLLRHSTLPVKLVAASVGFSDLQQFNKAVRSEFGMCPRNLRGKYVQV